VRRIAAAAAALLLLAGTLLLRRERGTAAMEASVVDRPRPIVPPGVRIRVEVLNATGTRGLARRATFVLRDAGFDVVRFATDTARRERTLVLDRSDHPDWSVLVARALGGARVESRPDSSRYLDVTILIGADWRPPPKPFYP
jgi:hypothetical protein